MSPTEEPRTAFTGLILLSGIDKPGVTEGLFAALSPFAVTIQDLEQVVIRGRLILTALITLDPAHAPAIEADITSFSESADLDFAIDYVDISITNASERRSSLHVVLLAPTLLPTALAAVAGEIAHAGGNIDRIRRTASFPLTAIEFDISVPISEEIDLVLSDLRRVLARVAIENSVDLAVEMGGLTRRAKRVVMLDMDSTLIQQEVIDLLAAKAGVEDEVTTITASAMAGNLDFSESLKARVKLLAGLDAQALTEVAQEIVLTPGARTLIRTLHRLGHKVGVVSGGFINVIEPLLQDLQVDFYRANSLEILDGKLTGFVSSEIIDRAAKAVALREFATNEGVQLSQTIAIGDGANDLDMIEMAGMGIAFNAKPTVMAAADSSLNTPYLDSVLYLMGITREEIEWADEKI